MISYYRIYYDQQIKNFASLNQIYIHKPLPTYEITQDELAAFINANVDSVSFKCELNRYIYAVARYIPWKNETRFPIEKQTLFDVFIFPTPIKNKVPSYVTPTSIKSVQPFVLRNKLDTLDPMTATIVDQVMTPINSAWSGVQHWYKKMKTGMLRTQYSTSYIFTPSYGQSWSVYSKYFSRTEPDFHRLAVEKITLKNLFKTPPYIHVHYSVNPSIRSVTQTEWNAMSDGDKFNTRSNFTNLTQYRVVDMLNPGKNSYFNPWLRAWWTSTRLDTSYYRQYETAAIDAMYIKLDPWDNEYCKFQIFIDNWAIRYHGDFYDHAYDYTMFNLLSANDMSYIPYEYLSDTSYYSLFNKVFSFELESPINLADETNWRTAHSNIWVYPEGTNIILPECDSTSFQWKGLQQYNPSYQDDTTHEVYCSCKWFITRNKYQRSQIERDNMLLPIWTKSYVFRDKSTLRYTTHTYHVVYTIRYLKKETIDWLIDSTFDNSVKWFVSHIKDLTNIKYDQHWFAWIFTIDSENEMTTRNFVGHYEVNDQTLFSYSSDDLTEYTMDCWRLMYNFNETVNESKWNPTKVSTIMKQSRGDTTSSGGYYGMRVSGAWSRRFQVCDNTNAVQADFTTYCAGINPTRYFNYSAIATGIDVTSINTISQSWTDDMSYYAALDVFISHILGFEDGIIVNEVKRKSYTEFLFRDIATVSSWYQFGGQGAYNTYSIKGYYSQWGVKTNDILTANSANAKLIKWSMYDPNPSAFYATTYPQYDKSSSKTQSWSFYRNGSGTTTSYTKTHSWDTEYFFDHYSGHYGSSVYLYDVINYPYSDITRQNSPTNAMFYIARPGLGSVTAEYPVTNQIYSDVSPSNVIPRKYSYSHIRTLVDTSGNIARRADACIGHSHFESGKDEVVDVYSKCLETFMRMTPYDLMLTESYSSSGVRFLTNLWSYHRTDDTVEYALDWIDATTCVPLTIMVTERLYKKWNTRIDNSSSNRITERWRFQLGWCMKMPKMLVAGSSTNWSWGNVTTILHYLRSFQLDKTTDLVYIDLDSMNNFYSSTILWAWLPASNTNFYGIHRRTPTLHMVGRDNTTIETRQNAILDLLYFHMTASGDGYFLPKKDLSTNTFDNTAVASRVVPFQNLAKNMSIDNSSVSINAYDNMLYAGDITEIVSVDIDPRFLIKYNPIAPTFKHTRDLGVPLIAIDQTSLIPINDDTLSMSLSDLIDVSGYQHMHIPNVESLASSNDTLIKNLDHTVTLEFDFQDNTFTTIQTKPTSVVWSNTLYTDNIQYLPLLWDYRDYTGWSTLSSPWTPTYYYKFKNSPDSSSVSSIYDVVTLKYDDYTFENRSYAANADQSSKYVMSRIQVNASNLVQKATIQSLNSPVTYFSDFTSLMHGTLRYSPVMNRGEVLYKIATFPTNQTFVLKLRQNWLLMDGTDKTRFYVAFVYDNVLINVGSFNISELEKILPVQAWAKDPFLRDVWLMNSTTSQVANFITKIKTTSTSPTGNMYMVSDYDSNFLELVFIDILDIM